MNAHRLSTTLRRNLAPLTALCLLSLVVFLGFAASAARPRQDGEAAPARDEREFRNEIPEHLPIKVKIKSEKSFKDLKDKGWLRELEVEVKNTGSKPIYYVQLLLDLPDVLVGGYPLAFSVSYGRTELFYPETAVEPGDVPIMPGESATLKAGAQTVKGYEYHRDELRERDDPKKVVCRVTVIKFGDGTGLWGRDGKLDPPKHKSKSSNELKQKNGAQGCRSGPALGTMDAPGGLIKVSNSWQPASFLRAYFLPPVDAPALAAAPDDCGCHSVSGCKWGNVEFANCPSCPNSELAVIFAGGCGNIGRCLRYVTKIKDCPAESDPTLKCTWDDITSETCFLSDPTPTPTPTSTPTPTPTPTPSCTPEGMRPNPCCEPKFTQSDPAFPGSCIWNCNPSLDARTGRAYKSAVAPTAPRLKGLSLHGLR